MFTQVVGLPIRRIRGYLLKRKLSNKDAQIVFGSAFLKVNLIKAKNAKFIVKGKLKFVNFMKNSPVYIYLEENATLQIDGDFFIANGVQILVSKNVFLKIGGNDFEKNTGINNDVKIYVLKKIEIGKDFICAFNGFITDCDWHCIEYNNSQPHFQSDVIIGDHVWVCHGTSILKGTEIGRGSIVGSRSVLSQKKYPENSLIAGTPAKVIKSNCKWTLELPETQ